MILNEKIPIEDILLCTFTEKATKEIKVRAYEAFDKNDIPYDDQKVRICTIHSFCNQFLQKYLLEIPYELNPNYHILDENEQLIFVFSNLITFGVPKDEVTTNAWNWAVKMCALFNNDLKEES